MFIIHIFLKRKKRILQGKKKESFCFSILMVSTVVDGAVLCFSCWMSFSRIVYCYYDTG